MWPFRQKAAPKAEVRLSSPFIEEVLAGGAVYGGHNVTATTAMHSSAVFACVRLISSAVACAPVKVYRRKGDLRERVHAHALERLLRLEPCPAMPASTFWTAIMQDKLLMGNAYAQVVRDGSGRVVALYPLRAQAVQVLFGWDLPARVKLSSAEKARRFYRVSLEDGAEVLLDQKDVLHVPNVGWDGRKGISTVRAMAQAVGLALAAEKSSAAFFENGMQSQIAISIPGTPSEEATARLIEHLKSRHTGAGNHHKPLILTNDGKANVLSMTAEDAQLLDSRKFSVIDICRFFGVHPVMVGENEKTSSFGGGIEQMGRWFNTLTLNSHFTAIEQELEIKLFGDAHFAEFDETEITRGDTAARADYFKAALGSMQQPGWMTVNEVRAAEGHGPMKGGDTLQTPKMER